jgi:hypothetical protein
MNDLERRDSRDDWPPVRICPDCLEEIAPTQVLCTDCAMYRSGRNP